jgi:Cu(I)/Ag(I) efflux system periplasmic protein CusF
MAINTLTRFAAALAFAFAGVVHAAPQSDGEVTKIDKDAGKLTIRHGELKNLDMPPMAMVFRVKDPAMLGQVKVGSKIRFTAEKVGGALTVTELEPVK